MGPLAITYVTEGVYESLLPRWLRACEACGLDTSYEVVPVGPEGWIGNCLYKSTFIQKHLATCTRPLLWLDADAVVAQPPELLLDTEAEFAAYLNFGRTLISATLYFTPTDAVRRLVRHWVQLCEVNHGQWDQRLLQRAYNLTPESQKPRTLWLPKPYCYIMGRSEVVPPSDAVIVQHQASRQFKRKV